MLADCCSQPPALMNVACRELNVFLGKRTATCAGTAAV